MKRKLFMVAAAFVLAAGNIMAQETCTKIYDEGGENSWTDKALSYTQGQDLFLGKDKFALAEPGNAIKISGFLTGDGDGAHKLYVGEYDPKRHLPGADYRSITVLSGENPVYFYLTEDMLYMIRNQDKDVRIYGEGITVNRVDLCSGKGELKSGRTLWTGWHNVDSWTTLELFKEAFTERDLGINLNEYYSIRIYHDAGRTDFTLNLIASWENPALYNQSNMTMTNTYAELVLKSDVISALTSALTPLTINSLKIQGDKGSGTAFNITDVVLIPRQVDGCDNCFYYTR